jgi:hypothetical protein
METKPTCNFEDCISKVDAKLKEDGHNAELSKTFAFAEGGMYTTVTIPLVKIDKSIRGKIIEAIQPSHCPFCGGKRIEPAKTTDKQTT